MITNHSSLKKYESAEAHAYTP